ncbi:hypothetical protein [Mesorhizobium sp. M0771]|uniref:hypothetical protein n=1 Tax=Mesorhizobium sp. M0771 TaxID=2956997 RepID=UPI00333AF8F7
MPIRAGLYDPVMMLKVLVFHKQVPTWNYPVAHALGGSQSTKTSDTSAATSRS